MDKALSVEEKNQRVEEIMLDVSFVKQSRFIIMKKKIHLKTQFAFLFSQVKLEKV